LLQEQERTSQIVQADIAKTIGSSLIGIQDEYLNEIVDITGFMTE